MEKQIRVVYNGTYGNSIRLSAEAENWLRTHGYPGVIYNSQGDMIIPRHNPLLVECVETLGDAVNGTSSVGRLLTNSSDFGTHLKVRELAGPLYYIENNDGLEKVIGLNDMVSVENVALADTMKESDRSHASDLKRTFTLELPDDMWKELEAFAEEEGKNMAEFLSPFLRGGAFKAIRDSKFAKLFKAKTQSTPVMSHEEAMKYYKAAIGGLDISVEELLNDPRLCHILIHGSGIFPKYVQDEDAFFDAALQILSEKEKNEKADDSKTEEFFDDNSTFEVPDNKDFVAPVSPDPAHEEAYEAYRRANYSPSED